MDDTFMDDIRGGSLDSACASCGAKDWTSFRTILPIVLHIAICPPLHEAHYLQPKKTCYQYQLTKAYTVAFTTVQDGLVGHRRGDQCVGPDCRPRV